jgi:hypothetical protein
VVVKGKATDASGVGRVIVVLNEGEEQEALVSQQAAGNTVDWMVTLLPEQGSNTVKVWGVDERGNRSKEMLKQFDFALLRPELAGTYDGLLVPETSLEEIEASHPGEPGVAECFVWTHGRGLLTLTVTELGAVTGKVSSAGMVQAFKGTVMRDGTVMFGDGNARLGLERRTGGKLVRELRDTLWSGWKVVERMVGEQVTGVGMLGLRLREGEPAVVSGELEYVSGDVVFAGVVAERHVYSAARTLPEGLERVPQSILDPARDNGGYTAVFEALADEDGSTNRGVELSAFPQGFGSGRLTVSPAGVASFVGRLADGTAVTYSNRISRSRGWPVYAALYGNRGYVTGQVLFDADHESHDAGCEEMEWVRPSGLKGAYAGGWPGGIAVGFAASKYVAPARPTARVPAPTNPYGVFGPGVAVNAVPGDAVPAAVFVEALVWGGGILDPVLCGGTLDGGHVVRLGENQGLRAAGWKCQVRASDGSMTGVFVHPVSGKVARFSGVVFQKRKSGLGSFANPSGSGTDAEVGVVEVRTGE